MVQFYGAIILHHFMAPFYGACVLGFKVIVNVGELVNFKPKLTATASHCFLAVARLSCLISRLPSVSSCLPLVLFPNVLPSNIHASFRNARDQSTYAYDNKLCLENFCLLGPLV